MCTASYNEIVTAAATTFVHDLLPLRFVLHNYPNIWLLAENSDEDIPIVRDECGRSLVVVGQKYAFNAVIAKLAKVSNLSLSVCVCSSVNYFAGKGAHKDE